MYKTEIIPIKPGGSNSYLIKSEDGYILVDAGLKGAAQKLLGELQSLQSKPEDIILIIVTHNHYDHIQGLAEVKKLTGAAVAMHKDEIMKPGEEDIIRKNESSLIFRLIVKLFEQVNPNIISDTVNVDIDIVDGMNLREYGVDAKIIHTPGHSPGSVCIVTDDGQCICGDTLFNMFPCTHYPIIVYNRKKLAGTYRRLDSINPDIYYPGHGKPITREMFKTKIMNRKKYFKTGGQ